MPEGLRVQPAPALELGLGLPSLRLTLLCDQGFLVKILNRLRLPGVSPSVWHPFKPILLPL
jgi:hypothetical protein